LTSEDTGAYGRDIGTSLPELLWKLVEVIPEGCMLRVGMTNPPYILEHLEVKLVAFCSEYATLVTNMLVCLKVGQYVFALLI